MKGPRKLGGSGGETDTESLRGEEEEVTDNVTYKFRLPTLLATRVLHRPRLEHATTYRLHVCDSTPYTVLIGTVRTRTVYTSSSEDRAVYYYSILQDLHSVTRRRVQYTSVRYVTRTVSEFFTRKLPIPYTNYNDQRNVHCSLVQAVDKVARCRSDTRNTTLNTVVLSLVLENSEPHS